MIHLDRFSEMLLLFYSFIGAIKKYNDRYQSIFSY